MTSSVRACAEADALHARRQSRCFVCGAGHPHGLRIRFETGADASVHAVWTPTADWEGFQDIIHGGIVSTVLDEAMSKAVMFSRCEALTGELRVRFRRHVSPGETLYIRAWVARRRKRLVVTEATLTGPDGVERAHAWASLLALRAERKSYEDSNSNE